MLGRTINQHSVKTNNFTWPFAQIADTLRTADITLINLENPIIKKCPLTGVGFTFCSDIRSVEGLTFAGIDVANLANNHTGNYGQSGLDQTLQILSANNILSSGAAAPVYKEIEGTKFSFLGFNDTFTPLEIEDILPTISLAAANSDITVVSFHWGVEYTSKPINRQVTLAHAAIDSGADIIVGNHPHWSQTIEEYKGKYIYYSHGNFIFDQFWSQETQKGIIIKTFVTNKQLSGYQIIPIRITSPGIVTQL